MKGDHDDGLVLFILSLLGPLFLQLTFGSQHMADWQRIGIDLPDGRVMLDHRHPCS